ncbi:DUF4352 domain-containing protein [Streptomyces sp. NBC_01268]|uniref:DUF4352 domain-containing protein n=1 Tax=Streptomyces sp. NBC_01268 TaxID=2903806 RepID=UPI002E2FF43D|nr:DUF4352 domain-containing protein [Streptomyces sp. NBC_01268]
MTQPPYPPQQPQHGQQWGPPSAQPYPGGPYGPPPPKKGLGAGAIVAIVLGSIFGLLVILGVVGAMVSSGSSDDKAGPKSTRSAAPAPTKSSAAPPAEEPAEKAPVTVTARKTSFAPSVLHDGGAYTSVTVTITNVSAEKPISTNPLYFTITDSTGAKHQAELGEDENQMDLMKLARGEKATGVITGKGKFTPAYVTYTDGLFGEGVRGDVH